MLIVKLLVKLVVVKKVSLLSKFLNLQIVKREIFKQSILSILFTFENSSINNLKRICPTCSLPSLYLISPIKHFFFKEKYFVFAAVSKMTII